ncbi:hypothetical protein OBV_05470 [Oscillibacter valericigenes Sjm18-20]|nr:hypothetical protein OBV_05470 [Oscillibacter valericigenes Sjm18-20]
MGIPALSTTNPSTLGNMLLQSAAYFQASSAKFASAEGEKLQAIVAAITGGDVTFTDGTFTTLSTINSDIQLAIGALSNLENLIMQKVAAGTQIYNR